MGWGEDVECEGEEGSWTVRWVWRHRLGGGGEEGAENC